ncbi:second ORF in transposon ISC1058 [Saccharolobus islandicus L.D.8.5]|uniref:Second ORF in transposon ISC1058 n=1 Tax=Saccharolobus islandicus (strain L.D.8.5 / Lassen \|nr:second ORF in transposon ISC1058 [Sulfolobus islandicus L.D.8.5]
MGSKTRDSKFLKIEIVIDNNESNVINAEITSNEVETAVKIIKDLQDKGKKFYGDKVYDSNEAYKTGVEAPPRLLLKAVILLGVRL